MAFVFVAYNCPRCSKHTRGNNYNVSIITWNSFCRERYRCGLTSSPHPWVLLDPLLTSLPESQRGQYEINATESILQYGILWKCLHPVLHMWFYSHRDTLRAEHSTKTMSSSVKIWVTYQSWISCMPNFHDCLATVFNLPRSCDCFDSDHMTAAFCSRSRGARYPGPGSWPVFLL